MKQFSKMLCQIPLSTLIQVALAEFLGTYVLVAIGNGSVAQAQLSHGEKGDYFAVNWGWALGCTLGLLISANVSGGHLNPAVTLALCVNRKFEWRKLPVYWLAQYLGSLAASGTVLGVYYEAIMQGKSDGQFRIQKNSSDPGTAAIFANYPAPYSSAGAGLIEEILATMIFMLVICAATDQKYSNVPKYLQPLYIGFALLALGISYGSNSGYALNPARDLGPRIVSYFGGWGPAVFSFRDYNSFWIFIVGPHIGAVLGVLVFQLLINASQNEDSALQKDGSTFQNHHKQIQPHNVELENIRTVMDKKIQSQK